MSFLMEIKMKASKLKQHPSNPRDITEEAYDRLVKKIQTKNYMKLKPIVHKDGLIYAGNQRFKVLTENLKLKEIPDEWLIDAGDDYTQEELIEFMILDNKNDGEYVPELILKLVNEEKLFDWGIELDFSITTEPEETIGDDDIPEQAPALTVKGDLYELGEHRLLCGDSTMVDDVEKLMDGNKADMVFTDPPYGMKLDTDYSGMSNESQGSGVKKSNKWDKIIGDDKQFDIREFDWIDCKEQFWCGADYYVDTLPNYGKNGAWFIWDKRTDENMDKMWGSNFETIWSLNKHKREVIRIKWSGIFGREKDDTKKIIHPTQKPTMLSSFFIDKYGGNLILDLFLGSGSTLIACEKTNRICYGMELDPKYIDVIIQRYEDYTGNKAIKIS